MDVSLSLSLFQGGQLLREDFSPHYDGLLIFDFLNFFFSQTLLFIFFIFT